MAQILPTPEQMVAKLEKYVAAMDPEHPKYAHYMDQLERARRQMLAAKLAETMSVAELEHMVASNS